MDYVIVITGVTNMTLQCIDDIVGDVKMYLDDERIAYDAVYLKVQEVEGTDG